MKTNAAFKVVLGFALTSTFLVGDHASAQMKSTVAPKATSRLSTKVKTAAKKEEPKSPFGLNINGTHYGKLKKTDDYFETYLTGSYDIMENVNIGLETGFESYYMKQEKNNAYDLEPTLTISGMEFGGISFNTGGSLVLPTSRSAHDNGQTVGFSVKGNFSTSIEGVSLGLDNSFYQFGYSETKTPTPFEDDSGADKFYENTYSRLTHVVGMGIPIGPVKWKHDVRYRVVTPLLGEESRPVRYRTRVAYGFTDAISGQIGVSWQKNILDKKAEEGFFHQKYRTLWFQLSLDI